MVQLLVSRGERPGAPAEWLLLELQGELESRQGGGLAGRLLGDLLFTAEGAPVLLLGHHVLHGKLVRLERPFAVLSRRSAAPQLLVTALVRRKLLFKTRPKPIIAGAARKA